MGSSRFAVPLAVVLALVLPGVGGQAYAVPSFARQTKLSCDTCHRAFPELNAFGRDFKLNGYTLTGAQTIEAKQGERTTLALLPIAPVSLMVQSSYTSVSEKLPGTQNGNVDFPQQLSLFLAGAITPHVGAFIQVTYDDQEASVGIDNTDIRFADRASILGKGVLYGVTLNNNPTVQDVWNSTPAWGFPYATSSVAPAPAAATILDGALAQEVAGLGAYALFDDQVYAELTFYRSAPQGGPQPPDASAADTIRGVATYWRLAYQHQWAEQYLEAGAYGLSTGLYPSGVSGPTDDFSDVGFDVQYEHALGDGLFLAHATWIIEDQDLDATSAAGGSMNASNDLRAFRVDGTYRPGRRYGFTAAYFSTAGDADAGLYDPAPVGGSRTGSPDSSGFIAQVQAVPWQNAQLALQYVAYDRFNGSSRNYDGFGRDASDNDTLYLLLWLSF